MDGIESEITMKKYLYFPEINRRKEERLSAGKMMLDLWEDYLNKEFTDYLSSPEKEVLHLGEKSPYPTLNIDWSETSYNKETETNTGTLRLNYAKIDLTLPFGITDASPWYSMMKRADVLLKKTNENIFKSSFAVLKREIDMKHL